MAQNKARLRTLEKTRARKYRCIMWMEDEGDVGHSGNERMTLAQAQEKADREGATLIAIVYEKLDNNYQ